jgi:hypothetical protein
VQEHSTETRLSDECGHICNELRSISYVVSKLLRAIDELIDVQHGSDPTTWSIEQAKAYCDAFTEYHPTVTVQQLITGLDSNADALLARVRWERNDS